MPERRCTCLSPVEVMQMMSRGAVMQSRDPCPLHPEPTFPEGTFVPRVELGPLAVLTVTPPA
jgi:hypothetical protein